MPGFTRSSRFQALVGGFVLDKLLGLEIELELASKPGCGVRQVAECIAGHRRLDGTNGIRPAFDAIQEVASMAWAVDQADFEARRINVDQVFRLQVDAGAIHVNPSVAALKRGAMRLNTTVPGFPFVVIHPWVARWRVLVMAVGNADKLHRNPAAKSEIDFPRRRRVTGALQVAKIGATFDFDCSSH